ncbi:MAG: S41 family peptidase [Bacteriovoracia bacterium]
MKNLKEIIIIFLMISFTFSVAVGKEAAPTPKGNNSFESLELFNKVLHLVETQYYRSVDSKKLIQGAINGMMETLDPHSAFLPEDIFEKMQEDTSGEFGGLGLEVTTKDGVLYVITPIDDTPAFKAGILSGDLIVEIDHESTLGLSLQDAVDKMRGKPGSKISLGIKRDGVEEVKYFELVRKKIQVKPIKYQVVQDNFAYIRLTQFQRRSAQTIVSALKEMKKKAKKHGGLKGIILDLRFNPGGLLDEAVEVSSIFLKEGVVVSTEGRDPKQKEIRYVNKSIYKELDIPLAVLINGASASASEIVAGALQDHNRAIIMGSLSFGKGSVQSVAKIDDQNGVKLTIAQYLTPNNRRIQAMGISPDIELVDINKDAIEKNKIDPNFIREKDLRNHLSATIETPEEKERRLEEEKQERIRRQQKRQKQKNKNNKVSKEEEFKRYNPTEDYKVSQAINYLKSYKIFKKQLTKE